MSAEPKTPQSPGRPPAKTVSPDVDETLHTLWTKYGQTALTACVLVAVFYLGKVGWDYYRAEREVSLGKEFASLSTPSQWRAFAADHPHDRLAGLADLDVADDAYASGQPTAAEQAYEAAIPLLQNDPLQVRARIGAGVCLLQSGQVDAGEAILRAILNDSAQMAVVRAEAGYELASAKASTGHAEEARTIAIQVYSLDPRSPWAQKAMMLRPSAK